ncbi:hypothetical protein CH267_13045 [Rhodococcus sp. 06-621-2]|nr:GntR family transcriptional regulator [Rhodococcus sp. 06-621-2]OZC55497.1 hypothetical protein CH267_13045 [Rhodococcus sp. 06-621-2]
MPSDSKRSSDVRQPGGVSDTSGPYDRMKSDIQLGMFGPGDRLVETALAERYDISRTPIREALRRLQHEGWVVRGQRGMEVRAYTIDEIFDLYEAREIVEAATARAAAKRRTPADLARLREWMTRMGRPDLDAQERISANRDFHAAVWRASHNDFLTDALERLYESSWQYMTSTLVKRDRWHDAQKEHLELMEAIEAGDGDKAADIITRHLRAARDHRAAHFD